MAEIIVLGVILSIIFYELTDITPGGIIVPGVLCLYINQPIKIVYTIVVSVIAYFIVKLLSTKLMIYGKRRFALLIIFSFLLHLLINLILGIFIQSFDNVTLMLVGYTISGVIANNMYKQGVIKTVCSLGIVTGFLMLILILLSAMGLVSVL